MVGSVHLLCQAVVASRSLCSSLENFFPRVKMSTEPGPSGSSAAEGVLEVAHFSPEQLALIDRLIASRVAPTTGGAGGTGDPLSSTSSTSAGEHFLGGG